MQDKVLTAVMLLIPMILSLTVHEYSHARAALALNDSTAARLGRLTLSPLPHIDPIGTLILPLLGFMFGGFIFGWARPVPVNPLNFSRRFTMKTGMLFVAAAGPASNFVLAILASLLLYVMVQTLGIYNPSLHFLFTIFIQLNVVLAFFNLLPIPPLDGGRILAGVLPDKFDPIVQQIERFGFMLLIFLMFTPVFKILLIPADMVTNFLLTWPFKV